MNRPLSATRTALKSSKSSSASSSASLHISVAGDPSTSRARSTLRGLAAIFVAAGLASTISATGCSSSDPAASAATTPSTNPSDAADASTTGDGSTDPPTDVPPVSVEADPARDCPAPFNAVGKAPAAGDVTDFEVSGQKRSFRLILPPSTFTGPRPVLFAFHGTTENASKFITRANLADFVARGFVVVAPNAVGNGMFWPVWDGMRAPGKEGDANLDLDLFDSLLACTSAHYSIDKNRVYAVGHSAGGIFMNRLLRSRSKVLAGGIVASGVFSLSGTGSATPLDPMMVLVTWGGDNDTYRGTTPSGVTVPSFSFVEQASLASSFYADEAGIAHARCRGDDLGHAWLPMNDWFADVLLAHPKGTASKASLTLPDLPASAPAACSTEPYVLGPAPQVTCGTSSRAGCQQACQLMADCAVENRTVGPTLATQLQQLGFTQTSCAGCVSQCASQATTATDAQVLSCFSTKEAAATCGPGIEGAYPFFEAVNTCCSGKSGSALCMGLCQSLMSNSTAKAFFPTCQALVK